MNRPHLEDAVRTVLAPWWPGDTMPWENRLGYWLIRNLVCYCIGHRWVWMCHANGMEPDRFCLRCGVK